MDAMKPEPLCVLTGCTAVGKTALALAWAEAGNAEIVSCDSLLFYRGMDIGTAKPTPAERARVRHHLIDVLDLDEWMDVKRYVGLAQEAVASIEARGRRVLVVGGSGFYLRSFFAAAADDWPADPGLRAKLEERLARKGREGLVEELRALNPDGLGNLDTRNPRRVLRALERCLVSGRPLLELAADFARRPSAWAGREIRLVELAREPAELRVRIMRRAEGMIAEGLVEEVERLRAQGLEANPVAARAIGYRETLAWLKAGGSREELAEAIARNTWRLVRKQRTWMRTQLPAHRVVPLRGDEAPDPSALSDERS